MLVRTDSVTAKGLRRGTSRITRRNDVAEETSHADSFDFLMKVTIIGSRNVGKSTLLMAEESYNASLGNHGGQTWQNAMTAGKPTRTETISKPVARGCYDDGAAITFKTRNYHVGNRVYRLLFWDCAGSERFRTLTSKYCSGATAIIYMFDLTSEKSFDEVDLWLKETVSFKHNEVPRILVGNKCRSISRPREVATTIANAFAKSNGMTYFEADAQSGKGVEDIFSFLTSSILRLIPPTPNPQRLMELGIKIGPSMLTNAAYRRALASIREQQKREGVSFLMDWM